MSEFTVEELAAAAGTMTSTVRMYQQRGLLPPPDRRGRIAVYDDGHLRRLRRIAELQERGHSLAGIKELLDGVVSGRELADIVGITSWGRPVRRTLDAAELAATFPNGLTDGELRRAIELGLVEIDGPTVVVDDRFLRVGAELVGMGVPVATVLDEWEALLVAAGAVAARFTRLFEEHLWPGLGDDVSIDEAAAVLDRLGPLADRVTSLALESALTEAAGAFVRRRFGDPD